jgi:Flp pilus assembly protein protease CpaA
VGLIVFGIGFGLIMGTGMFFLVILPLRRERQEALAKERARATLNDEKKSIDRKP